MSGPLPKGKITLAERPDLRQWQGPGGYGIRPYAVGVDARIDPEGFQNRTLSAGDQWSPLHALQTNNTRYNICMI